MGLVIFVCCFSNIPPPPLLTFVRINKTRVIFILLSVFVAFSLSSGELFAQSQQGFDIDMYKQLLEVVHVAIQATTTISNAAADAVSYILV